MMSWLRRLFWGTVKKPTCIPGNVYGVVKGFVPTLYDDSLYYMNVEFTNSCGENRGQGTIKVRADTTRLFRIGAIVDIVATDFR